MVQLLRKKKSAHLDSLDFQDNNLSHFLTSSF